MGAIRVSFLVLRRWCNLCPYAEIAACHCYTTFLWRRHYSITADTSATGLTANFHKRSTIFAENRSWGKPTPFSYILFFSVGTPKPTSEKTRPSREKEKVLQSYHNISRFENSFSVNQVGFLNFQRYFLPLDGWGFFWYNPNSFLSICILLYFLVKIVADLWNSPACPTSICMRVSAIMSKKDRRYHDWKNKNTRSSSRASWIPPKLKRSILTRCVGLCFGIYWNIIKR